MTADEFRALRTRLGWSVPHIAAQTGWSRDGVYRWDNGTAAVPPRVAEWLERIAALMDANPPPRREGITPASEGTPA